MDFTKLPLDVIKYMALELDIPELLSLCKTSRKLNKELCENKMFWLNRLIHEYDITRLDIPTNYTAKTYYFYIHNDLLKGDLSEKLEMETKKGNLKLVKILVKHGAEVNPDPFSNYQNPFLVASFNGHLDIVKYLLPLTDPTLYPRGVVTAANGGYLDVVKYLASQGIDVHDDDDEALIFASREGHLDIVKYLVEEQNANVHADDDRAIKWAAENNHQDVVNYLRTKM